MIQKGLCQCGCGEETRITTKTIKVLCSSCNTHLFNTNADKLDYPMTGEMFDVIFPGFFLRPIPINLDIFCPACSAYPFYWDGSMPGAIGRNLNIFDDNGKPQVLQIKQILMGCNHMSGEYGKTLELLKDLTSPTRESVIQPINYGPNDFRAQPALASENDGKEEQQGNASRIDHENGDSTGFALPPEPGQSLTQNSRGLAPGGAISSKPAFPCPVCGAKKRFHKKGCMLNQDRPATPEQIKAAKMFDGGSKPITPPVFEVDPHLLSMESRVSSGPDRDEQPTVDDLKDLERDRERRASGRPETRLRPGEGFVAKQMKN